MGHFTYTQIVRFMSRPDHEMIQTELCLEMLHFLAAKRVQSLCNNFLFWTNDDGPNSEATVL